ncbi:12134_t:CDS:2, partial [Gigaspora rosea]
MTIQEFYDKIIKEQTTEEFSVNIDSSDIEFLWDKHTFHLKSDQTLPPSSFQNDIVNWIKNNSSGWLSSLFANSDGKKFVVNLMEVIWYIDMCGHDKFKE